MERIWTPVDLIRWTDGYLAGKGIGESRLNAELLLAGTLGVKRLDLYLQFDRPLSAEELAEFKSRLLRRVRREPLQYIVGTAPFRELTLKVDRSVLIPRPETELLVGAVLDWVGDRAGLDVLDVGTGSGAIALSLRKEGTFRRVVATDVSSEALVLAKDNAANAALSVEFRTGSLYEPVAGERFDVIVSNPPYVGESERESLDPEVVDWEPVHALFAGRDGLEVLRDLIAGAADHLRPAGLLAMEIGATQGQSVLDLVRLQPTLRDARVLRDYAGRDRIVLAEREGASEEANTMESKE